MSKTHDVGEACGATGAQARGRMSGRLLAAMLAAAIACGSFGAFSLGGSREAIAQEPLGVVASSTLDPQASPYYATNLFDGDAATAWVEGVVGVGIGEYVDISYPAGTVITGGSVWPGYWKTEVLFYQNAAPTQLTFSTGGQSYTVDITWATDTFGNVASFTFPAPLICDGTLRMSISGVRYGWDFEDTCISELVLTTQETAVPAEVEVSGETIDLLSSMAYNAYSKKMGGRDVVEGSMRIEDLDPDGKAFLLYWYQYFSGDPRVSFEGAENSASEADLQVIATELMGESAPDVLQRFYQTYVLRVQDGRVYMNGAGDFGSVGPYYFGNAWADGLDELGRLVIEGDVLTYDRGSKKYEPACPFMAWFEPTGGSQGLGYRLVGVAVGLSQVAAGIGDGQTSTQAPAIQSSFTPEELAELALDYCERNTGVRPSFAEWSYTGEGLVLIHLYNIVNQGEFSHTGTAAWYLVDERGVGSDYMLGTPVNLVE